MSASAHADLHAELSHDVAKALSAAPKPGMMAAFPGLASLPFELALPFAEQAVKAGLDLAREKFGPAFESLVLGQRDVIRSVVSDAAIEYARALLLKLEAVKPA